MFKKLNKLNFYCKKHNFFYCISNDDFNQDIATSKLPNLNIFHFGFSPINSK